MDRDTPPKPQETVRSQLRLPAELHQRLVEQTEITGRSMNAEIVHRLLESFELERMLPEGLDAVEARAKENAANLERMSAKLDEISRMIAAGPPAAKRRAAK
ncbi:TPA: Arc family DNA-binding protein [Stenotrophomonas maltophilia]